MENVKFIRRLDRQDYLGTNWAASTTYSKYDSVINDGRTFGCIAAHTSGAANEPAAGVDTDDYWVMIDGDTPDVAYECEIEGRRIVFTGYETKS